MIIIVHSKPVYFDTQLIESEKRGKSIMMKIEVKNQCRIALLENLGFTCKEDELIVDDFLLVGENEDILDEANFRVQGGKHFSYYYNFLTGTFKINSTHYDGVVVA